LARVAVPVRPLASASARPAVRATKPGARLPARAPAATGLTTRELLLTIHTGNDDLRGGNDNADVTIRVRGLPAVQQRNINGSRRWLGNYDQTVRIALPRAVPLEDLTELSLVTRFGGGIGGDNWNVDRVRVVAVTGDGERELANVSGSPLVRFTGQLHNHRIALSPR